MGTYRQGQTHILRLVNVGIIMELIDHGIEDSLLAQVRLHRLFLLLKQCASWRLTLRFHNYFLFNNFQI